MAEYQESSPAISAFYACIPPGMAPLYEALGWRRYDAFAPACGSNSGINVPFPEDVVVPPGKTRLVDLEVTAVCAQWQPRHALNSTFPRALAAGAFVSLVAAHSGVVLAAIPVALACMLALGGTSASPRAFVAVVAGLTVELFRHDMPVLAAWFTLLLAATTVMLFIRGYWGVSLMAGCVVAVSTVALFVEVIAHGLANDDESCPALREAAPVVRATGAVVVAALVAFVSPDHDVLRHAGFHLVPRSSLAKTPVRLANSVGVIDGSYRGHLMAPLHNTGADAFSFPRGTSALQLTGAPGTVAVGYYYFPGDEVGEVARLTPTERGAGGFGSTGATAPAADSDVGDSGSDDEAGAAVNEGGNGGDDGEDGGEDGSDGGNDSGDDGGDGGEDRGESHPIATQG